MAVTKAGGPNIQGDHSEAIEMRKLPSIAGKTDEKTQVMAMGKIEKVSTVALYAGVVGFTGALATGAIFGALSAIGVGPSTIFMRVAEVSLGVAVVSITGGLATYVVGNNLALMREAEAARAAQEAKQ